VNPLPPRLLPGIGEGVGHGAGFEPCQRRVLRLSVSLGVCPLCGGILWACKGENCSPLIFSCK